ncbi:unnamed protein product [Arabidopsis arenosa]|uniref:FBD domain-containing protein n=1 Tax=Arabidopsis arenosa TaxID=38785 RepID=A0A8S2AIL0_ARAAE|nr:unnamed protein product [Arabidopsis arenosa]
MALPASSRVNKFSLKWWFDEDTESAQFDEDTEPKDTEPAQFDEDTERAQFDQINRCLRDVLKRGVGDLYLWMFYVFREALPVFEKLSHLTVNLSNFCWSSMPMLIKKAPNLKTLNIDGPLHYESYYRCAGDIVCECVSEYSFLVSCPLEVLKITEYYGCFRELMQMKHFLEKLSFLELVEVHSQATGERKLKLIADLQRLPRASSKCKFEVVS